MNRREHLDAGRAHLQAAITALSSDDPEKARYHIEAANRHREAAITEPGEFVESIQYTPEQWEALADDLERGCVPAWLEELADPERRMGPLLVHTAATRALALLQASWPYPRETNRRFWCARRFDRLGRRGVARSLGAQS